MSTIMTPSSVDRLVDRFREISTFAALPDGVLRQMAEVTEVVLYATATIVFLEGDPADALYIIDDGEVEVIKGDPPNRLAMMGPGRIFGEMGLIETRNRSATVRTVMPTRLLRLEGQEVGAIMEHSPVLLYRLVGHLSSLLRETDDTLIRDLQAKNHDLETAYLELQRAQQSLIDKARLDREIALAAELQQAILPTSFAQFPGFDVASRSHPAREVGGDFYDVFSLNQQRFAIVMADVSDKGVYAGMFMTMCHALIHAEAHRNESPAQVLHAVHRLIQSLPMTRMFVTVFYATVDLVSRTLRYARAGHENPLLWRAHGDLLRLDARGTLLSAALPLRLDEDSIALQAGDLLVLYTDGVTEALGPNRQRYGQERLERFVRDHGDLGVDAFADGLMDHVRLFAGSIAQHDDIALVTIKVRDDG